MMKIEMIWEIFKNVFSMKSLDSLKPFLWFSLPWRVLSFSLVSFFFSGVIIILNEAN